MLSGTLLRLKHTDQSVFLPEYGVSRAVHPSRSFAVAARIIGVRAGTTCLPGWCRWRPGYSCRAFDGCTSAISLHCWRAPAPHTCRPGRTHCSGAEKVALSLFFSVPV